MNETAGPNRDVVFGQKYAYATASLLLGIVTFINMMSLEKGILAIVFAWLALRSTPQPMLTNRRAWAKAGLALGIAALVLVPTLLIVFRERFKELIAALQRLQ